MLTTRALVLNRIIGPYTRHFTQSACQAGKAPSGLLNVRALSSELDHRAAREWTAGFTPDDIPKAAYEVTYARSSGPGGQVSHGTALT
jgi:peptidyl-tRNA hydrolase ICT1